MWEEALFYYISICVEQRKRSTMINGCCSIDTELAFNYQRRVPLYEPLVSWMVSSMISVWTIPYAAFFFHGIWPIYHRNAAYRWKIHWSYHKRYMGILAYICISTPIVLSTLHARLWCVLLFTRYIYCWQKKTTNSAKRNSLSLGTTVLYLSDVSVVDGLYSVQLWAIFLVSLAETPDYQRHARGNGFAVSFELNSGHHLFWKCREVARAR